MDSDLLDFVTLSDGVDHVLTFSCLAENRVVAVEVWSRKVCDEELGTVCVWSSVRHGEDTWLVVLVECWLAFALELVAWATHSCASWVATLDHEVVDHAVKDDAVVESTSSEVKEASASNWRVCCEHSDVDVTFVRCDCNIDV